MCPPPKRRAFAADASTRQPASAVPPGTTAFPMAGRCVAAISVASSKTPGAVSMTPQAPTPRHDRRSRLGGGPPGPRPAVQAAHACGAGHDVGVERASAAETGRSAGGLHWRMSARRRAARRARLRAGPVAEALARRFGRGPAAPLNIATKRLRSHGASHILADPARIELFFEMDVFLRCKRCEVWLPLLRLSEATRKFDAICSIYY